MGADLPPGLYHLKSFTEELLAKKFGVKRLYNKFSTSWDRHIAAKQETALEETAANKPALTSGKFLVSTPFIHGSA